MAIFKHINFQNLLTFYELLSQFIHYYGHVWNSTAPKLFLLCFSVGNWYLFVTVAHPLSKLGSLCIQEDCKGICISQLCAVSITLLRRSQTVV